MAFHGRFITFQKLILMSEHDKRPTSLRDISDRVEETASTPDANDTPSLEEVLSRFDGRHNFRPQKPAYYSIGGLCLSIIGWLLLFVFPSRESDSFSELYTQIFILLAIGVCAIALALMGRKRAPGISFFGYLIAGGLILFGIIPLIVLLFID